MKMPEETMLNICGVGLKKITWFPNGSARISYKGEEELLCILRAFKKRRLMITDDHVFLFKEE